MADHDNDAPFHVRFWLKEGSYSVEGVDFWISLAIPDDFWCYDEALQRDGLAEHEIWWRQSRFRIKSAIINGGADQFFVRLVRWLEALVEGAEDCGFHWSEAGRTLLAFHFNDGLRLCIDPPSIEVSDGEWRWKRIGGTREDVVRRLYEAFRGFVASEGFLKAERSPVPLIEALARWGQSHDESDWAGCLAGSHRQMAARFLQASLHGSPTTPWSFKEARMALWDDPNSAAWDPDLALIEREVLTEEWDDWDAAQRTKHLLEVAFRLGPESYNTEYRDLATLRSPTIERWLDEQRSVPRVESDEP